MPEFVVGYHVGSAVSDPLDGRRPQWGGRGDQAVAERQRSLAETESHVMSDEAKRSSPNASVSLREVTAATVGPICALSETLTLPKKNFVAPNAFSIAQAYFEPKAWFRGVYFGEDPVGFLMLRDDPEKPAYFLWRFMIAETHHGQGVGCRALELLAEHVRTRPGAKELLVSCGLGEGGPVEFYEKCGFIRNGQEHGGEIGLTLQL